MPDAITTDEAREAVARERLVAQAVERIEALVETISGTHVQDPAWARFWIDLGIVCAALTAPPAVPAGWRMPANEEAALAAGRAYAEACADQEAARTKKPCDNDRWSSLCTETQRRLSALIKAAKGLTDRRTDPPAAPHITPEDRR